MTPGHYNSYKRLFREWYNTTHPRNEKDCDAFHILLGYHWDEMSMIDRARAEGYEDGYRDSKLNKESV